MTSVAGTLPFRVLSQGFGPRETSRRRPLGPCHRCPRQEYCFPVDQNGQGRSSLFGCGFDLLQGSRQGTRADLSKDGDLVPKGSIDSLCLPELVTAQAERLGREIDFEDLGRERMAVVGPLCRFVAQQIDQE